MLIESMVSFDVYSLVDSQETWHITHYIETYSVLEPPILLYSRVFKANAIPLERTITVK